MDALDKNTCSRTKLIKERFELMTKRAETLHVRKDTDALKLANEDKYIRICGESYRGVSLNDKSPLIGIGDGAKKSETVLKHFKEKQAKILPDKVWKSKEERRVQAWLIKQALTNHRSLLVPLGLKSHFEELLFCLDEVSLGDNKHERDDSQDRPKIVRSDILALGLRGGEYFPVLIELKYKRELDRLIDQLDNFIHDITCNSSVKDVFKNLLRTCSGVKETATLSNDFMKIIVWPKSKNPLKSTIEKLNSKGVLEIEYEFSEDEYNDIGKWAFTSRRH